MNTSTLSTHHAGWDSTIGDTDRRFWRICVNQRRDPNAGEEKKNRQYRTRRDQWRSSLSLSLSLSIWRGKVRLAYVELSRATRGEKSEGEKEGTTYTSGRDDVYESGTVNRVESRREEGQSQGIRARRQPQTRWRLWCQWWKTNLTFTRLIAAGARPSARIRRPVAAGRWAKKFIMPQKKQRNSVFNIFQVTISLFLRWYEKLMIKLDISVKNVYESLTFLLYTNLR